MSQRQCPILLRSRESLGVQEGRTRRVLPDRKPPDLRAWALIELAVPRACVNQAVFVVCVPMTRELNASQKIIAASVPSAPNTSPISEPAVGMSRKSRSARIGSITKIAPTDIATMIQIFLRYM